MVYHGKPLFRLILPLILSLVLLAGIASAHDYASSLNPGIYIEFERVETPTAPPGVTGFAEVSSQVYWAYAGVDCDQFNLYVALNGTLVYDIYYYFRPGTLDLIGFEGVDYTDNSQVAFVFSESISLSDPPVRRTVTVQVDYYVNYTYIGSENADLTLRLGSPVDNVPVDVSGHGEFNVEAYPVSVTFYSPAIGENITVIEGFYSPEIGAFVRVNTLDTLYATSPVILSGWTPPQTGAGEDGGGEPATTSNGRAIEEGDNEGFYALVGLAFIALIVGGVILAIRALRRPSAPPAEQAVGTPPPITRPATPPSRPVRRLDVSVKPVKAKVPAGGTVEFEITVPPGAAPLILHLSGPGIDKMYRITSPGAKKLELPAPGSPGVHTYKFTFTRNGSRAEYMVSVETVESKPKLTPEVSSVSAAPLAEIEVPVKAECPESCTVSLQPSPGLQALVEPGKARVEGSKRLVFKVRLGSGVKPGRYQITVVSKPGGEAGHVEVVIAEPGAPLLVPGYEILRKLGSGGFANVYLARRESDGSLVALKVPRIDIGETISGELMDRFRREAETWSKLQHPHIVRLVDHGLRPIPYLAMEYMEGGSLREKLEKHGRLKVGEAVELALALGDALSYAHHMGVIHRDIKPENVLFTGDGVAKLSDWGLVKVMLEASTRSGGGFKGTLLYAAPEQVDPEKYGNPDWRTDIYQFGALLYEVLTGRPPFTAESMLELVNAILSKQPSPPSTLNPEVPRWLDEIIMRALAKRKEDRWNSIDVMIYEIKRRIEETG